MSDLSLLLLALNRLNISKVDLANYLEVSRQMVYNYLSMDSFDEWPIKKRIKILELFEISVYDDLENLDINAELLQNINTKLHINKTDDIILCYKALDERSKQMVNDIIHLCEEKETRHYINVLLSLVEHSMISNDYKYLITYLAKVFEKQDPTFFDVNADEQMAFEGILYSAFNLFNSNKYSKDKTTRVHEQFVKDIQNKSNLEAEKTNVINISKIMAKNELGIDKIDESNIDLVLEKILEIQGRKL